MSNIMIGTIIFIAGIVFAAFGALLLIKFDGEIKRAIAGLILVVIGLGGLIGGNIVRTNQNQEYVIIQISTEMNGIKYVAKEKFNGITYSSDAMVNDPPAYTLMKPEFISTAKLGDTITKAELEANKK